MHTKKNLDSGISAYIIKVSLNVWWSSTEAEFQKNKEKKKWWNWKDKRKAKNFVKKKIFCITVQKAPIFALTNVWNIIPKNCLKYTVGFK